MSKRLFGFACLAGFIGCIFAANYMVAHVGAQFAPGAPHTITFLGLTAPSGVLIVGVSFTLRDFAQMVLGKWLILIAIIIGAGLSYLVAPSLALASGAAFLFGEGCDWAAYTPLAERGKWLTGLVVSNTIGSFIDSMIFLQLAFHNLDFLRGQFVLKALMTVPFLAFLLPFRVTRIRRAVLARHASP